MKVYCYSVQVCLLIGCFMNKKINLKRILRKTFCLGFALITFFVYGIHDPYAVYAAITVDEKEQSYKWTRVESYTDFERLVAKIQEKPFSQIDQNYNNDKDWTRVMVIYQKGSDYYFLNQAAGSDANTWWGQKVLTGFGIDLNCNVFYTRTGLDTPFIKKCSGTDDEHFTANYPVCFRLCETGTEKMSDYIASCELNFFGIKWHGATEANFTFYAKNTNRYNGNWKSSSSANDERLATVDMKFGKSWRDYFDYIEDNFGIEMTIKKKNALMYVYKNFAKWVEIDSSGVVTRSDVSIDEILADLKVSGISELKEKKHNGSDFAKNSTISASKTGFKYKIVELIPVQDRINTAYQDLADNDNYDLSIFEETIENMFGNEVSAGAEAYNYGFESRCKYYDRQQSRSGDGMVTFTYTFSGIGDRAWTYDGAQIQIKKYISATPLGFYIYLGEPYNTPKYRGDVKMPVGITYFGDTTMIENGNTVTVPIGATLVVSGYIWNNGKIVVDGGNLIILGTIDTNPSTQIDGNTRPVTNEIIIKNGGKCVVSKTGAIYSRDKTTSVTVTDNSTLQVNGCIVTANLSITNYSTVRGSHGSTIYTGVTIEPNVNKEVYNVTTLRPYKARTIGSIVDDISSGTYFTINTQSSIISDGLVYIPNEKVVRPDVGISVGNTYSDYRIDEAMKIW